MSNYPPGCHNAPWDEPERVEREIEVSATCTLSASAKITSYVDVEYDEDEDGTHAYYSISDEEAGVDFEAQHNTPMELLAILKNMCVEKANEQSDERMKRFYESIIEDCNLYQESEFSVEVSE